MVEKLGDKANIEKNQYFNSDSRRIHELSYRSTQEGQNKHAVSSINFKYLQSQIVYEEDESVTQKPAYLDELADNFRASKGVRLTFYGQQSKAILREEPSTKIKTNLTKNEVDKNKIKTFTSTSIQKRPATVQELKTITDNYDGLKPKAQHIKLVIPYIKTASRQKASILRDVASMKVNDANLLNEMLDGAGWTHGPETDNEKFAKSELQKDDFMFQQGRKNEPQGTYKTKNQNPKSSPLIQTALPDYQQSLLKANPDHDPTYMPATQTSASFYRRLRQSASSTPSHRYRVRNAKFDRQYH